LKQFGFKKLYQPSVIISWVTCHLTEIEIKGLNLVFEYRASNQEWYMSKKSTPSKSAKKINDKSVPANPTPLPGWPGYRTRSGRSGYDPLDTRTEAAHVAGTIFHKLFTGQISNPVTLFLIGSLGLILIAPLFLAVSEMANGNQISPNGWIFILISGIAGLAIQVNFIKNLLKMLTR
jgi:hypothetical protein